MVKSRHRTAFEKFRNEIEEELGDQVKEVILYGSVARDEETEESDVDVLVVVEDRSVKDKIFDISLRTMLEEDVYIAPKVITGEEFTDMRDKGNPFLSEIMPEAEEKLEAASPC